MKTSELKELNPDELIRRLGEVKRELLDLRLKKASGKLEKSHRMKLGRRDVARILTLIREKQAQG